MMGIGYRCRGLKSPDYEFKHEEKSLSQVRLSPSTVSKSFFLYFHMPATRSKIYFRFVRSKLTINVSTASRISSLCLFPVCVESMLKADRCCSVKYIWVLIIFYLPPYKGASPGQAATKNRKADQVVFLDASVPDSFIEGNGAGS